MRDPHASHSAPRNRLGDESSLYLRQHASNPVDWYPWGSEALERARREDKPILLSIGYSACHWCHVMAHESFEDESTAALMNQLFVNVKVDREERPDLDRIYQTAHQMLSQRGGGWPLTVFLAPADQRPFFTGTYFPREARYGMPGFGEVLRAVARHYAEEREQVAKLGAAVTGAYAELQPAGAAAAALDRAPLVALRAQLEKQFDDKFGGFGSAPKFPHPGSIELLLRAWHATAHAERPDLHALYMAALTLTRMAEGGIYDQVGGGFARYSVDEYWMIPHFEKMLYDNGQLLGVYAQAAVATGDALFRKVAEETADWMLRDLGEPSGAFYSTLDADSEGHEGLFYVWTPQQLRELLTPEEYAVVAPRFGLDREANFEGRWHLHCFRSIVAVAEELGLDPALAAERIGAARAKLLAVRNQRVWPGRDEKVLTGWNGLAIAGLAQAARALAEPDLAEDAALAAGFLRRECWREGRLYAVHAAGRTRFPAYLDDHAALGWGLTELLQARWDPSHLAWAVELAELILARFGDPAGGFYFTADDHESLIVRPKNFGDDATPSGNGLAARLLLRLGYLLGETRYLDAAEATLRAARPLLERFPHGHAALLAALDEYTEPPAIVILRGAPADMAAWTGELDKVYAPKRCVIAIPSDAQGLPAGLAAKAAAGEGVVAYVCRGMTCSAPVRTVGALTTALKSG